MNFKDTILISDFRLIDYLLEFVWVVISFLIITFLFVNLNDFDLENKSNFFSQENIPVDIKLLKILVLIIFFLVTIPLVRRVINFRKHGTKYFFKKEDWLEKWTFHGLLNTSKFGLKITNCNSGALLNFRWWKNFKMSFEMKLFSNRSKDVYRLGVLFRAEDLENYFMVEFIAKKPSTKFVGKNYEMHIRPHVRQNGKWEVIEEKKIGSVNIKNFIKCGLRADGRICEIFISSRLKYSWILPDRTDSSLYPNSDQNPNGNNKNIDRNDTAIFVKRITFLEKYGMVGFRANTNEGAYIKNIEIESLSSFERYFVQLCRFFKD